jgi:hypothetical protein
MENKKKTEGPVLDNYLYLLYLKAKVNWAEWMHRQSLRLGKQGVKIAFGVLTSLFGGFCLLLMISGGQQFYSRQPVRPDGIQTIRAPSATANIGASRDTVMMKQIEAFHTYMDKLTLTQGGRKIRDSLLKARPGLLDSIKIVESMYNNKKDE